MATNAELAAENDELRTRVDALEAENAELRSAARTAGTIDTASREPLRTSFEMSEGVRRDIAQAVADARNDREGHERDHVVRNPNTGETYTARRDGNRVNVTKQDSKGDDVADDQPVLPFETE